MGSRTLTHLVPASSGEIPLLRYATATSAMIQPLETACPVESVGKQLVEQGPLLKATLAVKGMLCASCSTAVESALRKPLGVKRVCVALLSNTAEVVFNPEKIAADDLVPLVTEAGFDAELLSLDENAADWKVYTLHISGMTCTACSSAVEAALARRPGVRKVRVGLVMGEAEVECDDSVREDILVSAVEELGYQAEVIDASSPHTVRIEISGMSSSTNVSSIEEALTKHAGVLDVTVSLATGAAEVRYTPDVTGPRELIKIVSNLGYAGTVVDSSTRRELIHEEETKYWRKLFLWSIIFSIPVFILAIVLPRIPVVNDAIKIQVVGFPLDVLLKWILTTPVQFIIGWRFQSGAVRALRHGSADMNVLVALGTDAAYIYSLISMIIEWKERQRGGDPNATDFFETSAMLVSFILLGKYLESKAKGKTSEAISSLLHLIPDKASLVALGEKGDVISEEEILVVLVQKGDYLKVYPGARIPADGEVLDGAAHVDESMITGESETVTKLAGSTVIGGTLNRNGSIIMRATRVGADTALSQIVRLVEKAQQSKAPIQQLADSISAVFVPMVLCLALITWVSWYASGLAGSYPDHWVPDGHSVFLFSLLFGISVLVIACPCALGLATPTAVMVGTGVGARLGILIKGGDALEKANKVDTVIFDKTGTLTMGRPEVVDLNCFSPLVSTEELLRLTAAVESSSEHPLGTAIMKFAQRRLAPLRNDAPISQVRKEAEDRSWVRPAKDVSFRPGEGVVGWTIGRQELGGAESSQAPRVELEDGTLGCEVRVLAGNQKFIEKQNIRIKNEVLQYIRQQQREGQTCVIVACQWHVIGVLCIADAPKPEAMRVLSELETRDIKCFMVTGDNWRTARAIARKIGMKNVIAEVMPAAKSDKVKELQKGGHVVAMVGDGVNDAPALVASDLGIAIGSGTDTAIEAADFVLMRNNLEDVMTSIDLAKKTFSRIKWNFMWAFGYNILMIPIAAGVLYPGFQFQLPPWIAGGAMASSSVSVVLSSLLLKRYKRKESHMSEAVIA